MSIDSVLEIQSSVYKSFESMLFEYFNIYPETLLKTWCATYILLEIFLVICMFTLLISQTISKHMTRYIKFNVCVSAACMICFYLCTLNSSSNKHTFTFYFKNLELIFIFMCVFETFLLVITFLYIKNSNYFLKLDYKHSLMFWANSTMNIFLKFTWLIYLFYY